MNDHQYIIRDIKRSGGLNSDIPPSVARQYREYQEKQDAASDERYKLMLRQKEALETRLQLRAQGFRQMEKMGFSSHNELMRGLR